jgi:hypothetical protein
MHRKVETEGGLPLGRVCDFRGELSGSSLTIVGLVVGKRGLLEHFGIVRRHGADILWEAVVRIDGDRIVVRNP